MHASRILIGSKQIDRAILATVCLHALETLLAIMQRRRTCTDMQKVIFGQIVFSSIIITPVRNVAKVGFPVAETQVIPIQLRMFHISILGEGYAQ